MSAIDCQLALLFLLIAFATATSLSSLGRNDNFESIEGEEVGPRALQWPTAEEMELDPRLARLSMRNFSKLGWPLGCGHAPYRRRTGPPMLSNINASFGEFPSYVRLKFPIRYCAGVLISSQHVLTNAHCLRPNDEDMGLELSLFFGDIYRDWRDSTEVQVNLTLTHRNTCVSPKFNSKTREHDWLIIQLQEALILNDFVQPACLARPSRWPLQEGPKSKCFIIGMGYSGVRDESKCYNLRGKFRLQKIRVELATCPAKFGIPPDDASRTCYERADDGEGGLTCWGDSGGPVLCMSKDNKWTVPAFVSGAVKRYVAVHKLIPDMEEHCRNFLGKQPLKSHKVMESYD